MKILNLLLVFALVAVAVARATPAPDPVAYAAAALNNPNLKTTDGELFCWNAAGAAAELMQGYEATRDGRWLEGAETYFDFLLGKLARDPDGCEGWIGRSIWGTPGRKQLDAYRIDAVVGDAILLAPMVRFAEFVKNDPALRGRFGASAARYVEKARQIGWEKWNARHTYYRDAAGYGSYRMPLHFISAETGRWVDTPVVPHSENLNKHSAMAIVMLRLWRVTGEPSYRARAEEIFARLKNLFRYFPDEDRVVWNFWMPHGPHDFDGEKLASWVGLHPYRPNYQSEEVARMVEAYDSGIVFDADDLRRLIRTNHFMMPSAPGGKWRTADGSAESGKLWASLARFDPRIRTAWTESLGSAEKPRERLELAYDEAVTAKELHWGRRFVKSADDVRVFAHRPQPGRWLGATVVIPDRLAETGAEAARLLTQTKAAGELKIELFDRTGSRALGELFRKTVGAEATLLWPAWDGTQPATGKRERGEFLVRWSLNGETRTERVWVGAPPSSEDEAPALPRGARFVQAIHAHASDFQLLRRPEAASDGDLTTAWTAEGNGQWIAFKLAETHQLQAVDLVIGQGAQRRAFFVLEASVDGQTWVKCFEGASSGTTAGFERFAFAPVSARYVRYTGFGNSLNRWSNLGEVRFVVSATEEKP